MDNQSQLKTLIELAQLETDSAAKRLGETLRAAEDAEQKHGLLQGYRDDYAQRFMQAQAGGISPLGYKNFQAFIGKLDNAIKGQQEVVVHAKTKIEQARTHWQNCERKRLSYQTLLKRANLQEQQRAAKRDQKAMDEHATRQAFYKR